MTTLHDASTNWATRADDERFESLTALNDHFQAIRKVSASMAFPLNSLKVEAVAKTNDKGLKLIGSEGNPAFMTNAGFSQLAELADCPRVFLASLPAHMTADILSYKLSQSQAEASLLLSQFNSGLTMRAALGAKYGRIWNSQIASALLTRFGDGTGKDTDWKVPGEFGKDVPITKANTTIFGSDRDMFVFLCDEKHKVELPNRRDGKSGLMSRGFFVQNSETGHQALKVVFFLFDYVCSNRIVWGATDVKEVSIKHTLNAPERWLEEIAPVLADYSNAAASQTEQKLIAAQNAKLGDNLDDVLDFTANKFGTMKIAKAINSAHMKDEGRDIYTMFDLVTGATAYARNIPYQDQRVLIERTAGKLIDLVAA